MEHCIVPRQDQFCQFCHYYNWVYSNCIHPITIRSVPDVPKAQVECGFEISHNGTCNCRSFSKLGFVFISLLLLWLLQCFCVLFLSLLRTHVITSHDVFYEIRGILSFNFGWGHGERTKRQTLPHQETWQRWILHYRPRPVFYIERTGGTLPE